MAHQPELPYRLFPTPVGTSAIRGKTAVAEKRVVSQFEFIALDGRSRHRSYCSMLSGKQGVDAMTIESPNVKGIWTTIEVDEGGTETVLIVETDLELNAAHPAFDAAKVDALIEAATKSFAA